MKKKCPQCEHKTANAGAYCTNCHSLMVEVQGNEMESKMETPEDDLEVETPEDDLLDTNEQEAFECPEDDCDRTFDTEQGKDSHYGQVHG